MGGGGSDGKEVKERRKEKKEGKGKSEVGIFDTSNRKDLTKFGSEIHEVNTSHLKLLFLNFCTPFRTKVMPLQSRDIFYG